jgi:penicillin-binding protein 1A
LILRWILYPLLVLLTLGLVAAGVVALTLAMLYPNLPSLTALTEYQPRVPLQVFTADGHLIGEFGDERRAVIKIDQVPKAMRQAILAAEDERFYQHSGVDYVGVFRAALANLFAGSAKEGASTITMQVARNFFLTREKTLTRKLSEMLLALKIERNLSKDQILELYINQIFLGQRAYGFVAAANTYFGKSLEKLTLAETAILAGLPKAPSRCNPVVNMKCAKVRQEHVLRRMRLLNFISEEQHSAALAQSVVARSGHESYATPADYVAEMVRQYMFDKYGEAAYSSGYKVVTTIRKPDQDAAYAALRKGAMDYDRRHGYRGPEGFVDADKKGEEDTLEEFLADRESNGNLLPAVVLEASPTLVRAYVKGGETIEIGGEGLKFVQRVLGDKVASTAQRIRRGAIIRVSKGGEGAWEVTQVPNVEAALVSIAPDDGAIRSLIGGFDFRASKFNHVTQALRQPGSSFKPFIYSAALEKNFTAATIVNDAPIAIDPNETGGELWEPKNFDDNYAGPMRLRVGLARSKNMVSIRILQAIGPKYAQDYVTRFGFDPKQHPAFLTLALGVGSATPLQVASGYCVFANMGYAVKPYFIERVVDQRGNILSQAKPAVVSEDAEQVLETRNAFMMNSLMRDVVRYGTATKAKELGRQDLAGKTGTTNDHADAWFAGFQRQLVAVAWIGFDNPANKLGDKETGAVAALPIWMGYMERALRGIPEAKLTVPSGVVQVAINPLTGKRDPDNPDRVSEYFYEENVPETQPQPELEVQPDDGQKPAEEIKNQLY